VLAAFDDYFGGRPPIDDIEMRVVPEESTAVLALRGGDLDFMIVRDYPNVSLLKRTANLTVNADERHGTSTYQIWMNTTRKPLNDVRVRRALIHATDRLTLALRVTEGLSSHVAHSVVPPTLFGYTNDVPKYGFDRARAKRMLVEAGYPNGFRATAIVLNTAYHPPTMTVVQAMWRQVGVDLQLELLDQPAIRPRQRNGDFDFTISDPTQSEVGQTLQSFDPRNIPGQNMAQYRARGLEQLIDAQAREIDPKKRAAIIKQVQQMIAADAPTVPLWNTAQATASRTGVRGHIPNLGWWQTRFWLMDSDR
jgi:ABC-type transport system substrate-binding protein